MKEIRFKYSITSQPITLQQTLALVQNSLNADKIQQIQHHILQFRNDPIFIHHLLVIASQQFLSKLTNIQIQQKYRVKLAVFIIVKNIVSDVYEKESPRISEETQIEIKHKILGYLSDDREEAMIINPIITKIVQLIAFSQLSSWPNLINELFYHTQLCIRSIQQNQHLIQNCAFRLYALTGVIVAIFRIFGNSITKQSAITASYINNLLTLSQQLFKIYQKNNQYDLMDCLVEIWATFNLLIDKMQLGKDLTSCVLTQAYITIQLCLNNIATTNHPQQSINLLINNITIFTGAINRCVDGYFNCQIEKHSISLLELFFVLLQKLSKVTLKDIHHKLIQKLIQFIIILATQQLIQIDVVYGYLEILIQLEYPTTSFQSLEEIDNERLCLYALISCIADKQYNNYSQGKIIFDIIDDIGNNITCLSSGESLSRLQKLLGIIDCIWARYPKKLYESLWMHRQTLGSLILKLQQFNKLPITKYVECRVIRILTKIYKESMTSQISLGASEYVQVVNFAGNRIMMTAQSSSCLKFIQIIVQSFQLFITSFNCLCSLQQNQNQNLLTGAFEEINLQSILRIYNVVVTVTESHCRQRECLKVLSNCHSMIGLLATLKGLGIYQTDILFELGFDSCAQQNKISIYKIFLIYQNYIQAETIQIQKLTDIISSNLNCRSQQLQQPYIQADIRYGCLAVIQQSLKYTMNHNPFQQQHIQSLTLVSQLICRFDEFIVNQSGYSLNFIKYLNILKLLARYQISLFNSSDKWSEQGYNLVNEACAADLYIVLYMQEALSEIKRRNGDKIMIGGDQQFEFYELDELVNRISIQSSSLMQPSSSIQPQCSQPGQKNINNRKVGIMINSREFSFCLSNLQTYINNWKNNESNYLERNLEVFREFIQLTHYFKPIQISIASNSMHIQVSHIINCLFEFVVSQLTSKHHTNTYSIGQELALLKLLYPILVNKQINLCLPFTHLMQYLFSYLFSGLNNCYAQLLMISVIGYIQQIIEHSPQLLLTLTTYLIEQHRQIEQNPTHIQCICMIKILEYIGKGLFSMTNIDNYVGLLRDLIRTALNKIKGHDNKGDDSDMMEMRENMIKGYNFMNPNNNEYLDMSSRKTGKSGSQANRQNFNSKLKIEQKRQPYSQIDATNYYKWVVSQYYAKIN